MEHPGLGSIAKGLGPRAWDRPEMQFLLCCVGGARDAATDAKARALVTQAFDWDALRDLAAYHQVTPAVYRSLARLGVADESPGFLALRKTFIWRAAGNARLVHELFRLLDLLARHGIEAMPIKGPVLAVQAFGDIQDREYCDLDILVRREDMCSARRVLVSHAGFTWRNSVPTSGEAAYLAAGVDFILAHPARDLLVELLWTMTPRCFAADLPAEAVWERTEEAVIEGRRVRTPGVEALLVLLCLHGAKHNWAQLNWIGDVAGILSRRRDIDWAYLMSLATRAGAGRMLLLGLQLASDLGRASLPDPVVAAVKKDPAVARLASHVLGRMRRGDPFAIPLAESLSFRLRCRERLRDRARQLLLLAFSPSYADIMRFPTAARRPVLLWLLRPLRLAARFIRFLIAGGKSPDTGHQP